MFCVLINFVLKLETYQNADGEGKVDGDGYVLCARIKIIGIFGSDALNSIKYHVNHVSLKAPTLKPSKDLYLNFKMAKMSHFILRFKSTDTRTCLPAIRLLWRVRTTNNDPDFLKGSLIHFRMSRSRITPSTALAFQVRGQFQED